VCLFYIFFYFLENANETPHLKHDGTSDKRYAENQQQEGAAHPHLKADGTPDLRFTENQHAEIAATTIGKFADLLKCIVEWFLLLLLAQLLRTNNHNV
jgi:hypothetical protein